MEEYIKQLKTIYFIEYLLKTLLFLVAVLSLILIVKTFYNSIVTKDKTENIVIKFIISMGLLFTMIWLIPQIVNYTKDLNSVVNNEFEEITGTVFKYEKNEIDAGFQSNNFPNIKSLDGSTVIILYVKNKTEINKTYTFVYLKHSKIGVIKKQHHF